MATDIAERFMRALQQAEQSGDVEPLAALFTDDAVLEKLSLPGEQTGRQGAKEFWQGYLDTFDKIRSTFSHVHHCDRSAVLEWTSEGALSGGQPIRYQGVSILELDDDRVRAFRTYYDTASFVRPAAGRAEVEAGSATP